MKLFYFPTPDLVLPSSSPSSIPPPDAAVAVDVLRATTTIARLLHCGAEAVQCFSDLDELRAAAERFRPVERRLLVGERGGQKLDGFDLGNAPSSVRRERVGGKRVFFSTSNGTRALHRVRDCPRVYAASLTNRSAVASRLRRDLHEFSSRGNNSDGEQNGGNVWIVGSGWQGNFSLEDTFGAGAVASALMTNQLKGFVDDTEITAEPGNDELVAALAVWEQWKGDPLGCLRASSHGKRLEALLGDEAGADLECCAAVDSLDVVPYQTEPGVLKGSWL